MALGPKEEGLRRQREARARGGDLQTVDRAGRADVVRKARTATPSVSTGGSKPPKDPPPAAASGAEDDPLMSPMLIAFTQGQKKWLDAEATRRGCRRSEVVRDAITKAMVR